MKSPASIPACGSLDEEIINDFAADVLEQLNGLPISQVEYILDHAKWLAKATHHLSADQVTRAVEAAASPHQREVGK